MSSTSKLAQKLSTIAASWPRDPFRPQMQLKAFLSSLSAHPNLTPQAVQAARALKDNDMFKKYPLSQKMLKPASMPKYYDRLMEGFDKSAKGIGRPWWKVFFGIW